VEVEKTTQPLQIIQYMIDKYIRASFNKIHLIELYNMTESYRRCSRHA